MFLDDLKIACPGGPSSLRSEDTDYQSPKSTKLWEGHGDGRQLENNMNSAPKPLRQSSTNSASKKKRFSMRIPIRVQLALLVLLTSMLALAVIAIATWFYNLDFVTTIKSQGLALTASLKAGQVASDLQLIQSTCATVVTRVLIQSALQRFYLGNTTDANWVRATADIQGALGSGGYSDLLQTRIYPRNNTGNIWGLLNTTSSAIPQIALPYTYANGSVGCFVSISGPC